MATSYADGLPGRSMQIGRVIGRAFSVLGANPLTMFGLSLLVGALPGTLIGLVLRPLQLELVRSRHVGLIYLVAVAGGLMSGFLKALATGALVRATVVQAEGRRAGIAETALAALPAALPLIGVSLIALIVPSLALLLLIVPGVMLYLMWSVAVPAVVEERLGVFAALGRSRRLTKGARWNIFGLQLIVLVFYYLLVAVLGAALFATFGISGVTGIARAGVAASPTLLLIGLLYSTVLTAVWSAIQTSLYVELRDWKDGPASEALAEIFA